MSSMEKSVTLVLPVIAVVLSGQLSSCGKIWTWKKIQVQGLDSYKYKI